MYYVNQHRDYQKTILIVNNNEILSIYINSTSIGINCLMYNK